MEAIERSSEVVKQEAPVLAIKRIGIISRDYNKVQDFSGAYREILTIVDGEGCDTALFSLYSILPSGAFDPTPPAPLGKLKSVCFEQFKWAPDSNGKMKRHALRFTVLTRKGARWSEYHLRQKFGSIADMTTTELMNFVKEDLPDRILGNGCILLCGETNGVKYSKSKKCVGDPFGLRRSIPKTVHVILNPIHDRMTRFEMKLKRRFLSEGKRWTISVWNRGKKDRNGRTRDGESAAWTAFHDGRDVTASVKKCAGPTGFEIGVIQVS